MADDLVERLREEALALHRVGIERGSVDASISGMLADEAADRITALQAQNRKLVEALTPSGDTKAAYMGEFSFQSFSTDEDGNETAVKTYVPWTTIKEIMAAIRARAATSSTEALDRVIRAHVEKALEMASTAVSEGAHWPEDEHGRTEQPDLFARVVLTILAITADDVLREMGGRGNG